MKQQQVIIVNESDVPVGTMEKMKAHELGVLHRAFSVFIFNSNGEMLLQQRAHSKYHSGGLWTNACCSHPQPGEELVISAGNRLLEEMGFKTDLKKIFDFVYRAQFENGLTEHEFDHVYFGIYDGPIKINAEEAINYKYLPMEAIADSVKNNPGIYTEWFLIAFPMVKDNFQVQGLT